ncbi:MAG TPA: type II toxin-antitoxin system prevent-host-death family antitoxin [Terriglobales bacterium]|jgi:prevent-host-death family protein|nr:type II toxin-antitoxin system prevent-host-death family antitoxin [Terriglobales bacterium]
MRKVGLFEAKQKLSELVERASSGEKIGITRRGKLAAFIVSARPDVTPQEIFDDIERIRKRARRTKKLNVKNLIEEGRE